MAAANAEQDRFGWIPCRPQRGSRSVNPALFSSRSRIAPMTTKQVEWHRSEASESRLRLHTAVRLRWFGVIGQLLTVCFVYLVLGFPLPFGICLAFIALSAWLNVFLRILYPARTRLSTALATCLLAYDILQLSALLYLTGGIENPFTFLLVAPVTVSAATLPPFNTIALGLLGAAATVLLVFYPPAAAVVSRQCRLRSADALQRRPAGLGAVRHDLPGAVRVAARQGGAADGGCAGRHRDGAGARAAAACARRARRRRRARARHAALHHRRGRQGARAGRRPG